MRADSEETLLRVMDLQGRTWIEWLMEEKGLHTLEEDLSLGLYLVTITGESGYFCRIVMKNR